MAFYIVSPVASLFLDTFRFGHILEADICTLPMKLSYEVAG